DPMNPLSPNPSNFVVWLIVTSARPEVPPMRAAAAATARSLLAVIDLLHELRIRQEVRRGWISASAATSLNEVLIDVETDDRPHQEQQEHEPDLHHALLDDRAEVPADQPLDREDEDMPPVEDRDRQEVDDAELQADDGHELQVSDSAALPRLARELVDVDRA